MNNYDISHLLLAYFTMSGHANLYICQVVINMFTISRYDKMYLCFISDMFHVICKQHQRQKEVNVMYMPPFNILKNMFRNFVGNIGHFYFRTSYSIFYEETISKCI